MSQKTKSHSRHKHTGKGGTYFKASVDAEPVLVHNTDREPEDPHALDKALQPTEEAKDAEERETPTTRKARGTSGD